MAPGTFGKLSTIMKQLFEKKPELKEKWEDLTKRAQLWIGDPPTKLPKPLHPIGDPKFLERYKPKKHPLHQLRLIKKN